MDEEKIKLEDCFLVGGAIGRHIGNGLTRGSPKSATRPTKTIRSWPGVSTDFENLSGDLSVVFVLGNIWRDIQFTGGIQPMCGRGARRRGF